MVTSKAPAGIFSGNRPDDNRFANTRLFETIHGGAIVNTCIVPFASILGIDKFLSQKNGIR